MRNINSKILFVVLSLIIGTGCCSTPTTIRETEKEVPIALPVKAINDSVPGNVIDSAIVGVKLSADGKDTVVKIIYEQVIPDELKNDAVALVELKKKFSTALSMLSELQGRFTVYAKNDSARGTVKEKERIIERDKEIGIFDYFKIGSIFALVGVLLGAFLKR